jgi:hypothetical protein
VDGGGGVLQARAHARLHRRRPRIGGASDGDEVLAPGGASTVMEGGVHGVDFKPVAMTIP